MERIKKVTKDIPVIDREITKKTQEKLDNLTKPLGSLGRLEELAKQICGITGKVSPSLENKVIFTFAADHGVTDEGVSAYPKEVTAQMVYNFLRGGAGINVLARHVGAKVIVVDIGVAEDLKPDPRLIIRKIGYGTKNMAKRAAMIREEAVKAIETGIEIFNQELKNGIDIIGIGEMGIGNTTAASAIAASFTGKPVEEVAGRGTGLDDSGLKNKIEVIKKSLFVNKPDSTDPIDVLSKVGGFEIAGLTGIILAAAVNKVPIVIDGFISGAAALVAFKIEPRVKEYMIAAHKSQEGGHKIILEHIGLRPLLDLDLRLGEGTGGALGIGLADAAIKILTQMATFKSAGVSEKKE
ncbi:MAG: nicotinate-nucleotide--dimethylbenzimidazole phosphoribosyltransferase [Candidatus Omnitrophica bacterium]|nr:nicotinate-nucleotide--dimethylbenzimidazole phosphoribosyltransferase [Candidatus Omnitrophota bacterium]MBU1924000.1 nicotinate-nucleotide--dimethylbenzimidazole phosphoribosyltransferase [Candidatus Omnitrophota bacterium]